MALLGSGGGFYIATLSAYDPWKVGLWVWVFASLTFAAVLGVITHALRLEPRVKDRMGKVLNVTLAVGIALFVVGAVYDQWGSAAARPIAPIVIGAALLLSVLEEFPRMVRTVGAYRALTMVFSLMLYAAMALGGQLPGATWMALAVLCTIIGTVVQAARIPSHPLFERFDHNGVCHVIQMIAVGMLINGIRLGLLT